jgi:hypothetical protein
MLGNADRATLYGALHGEGFVTDYSSAWMECPVIDLPIAFVGEVCLGTNGARFQVDKPARSFAGRSCPRGRTANDS